MSNNAETNIELVRSMFASVEQLDAQAIDQQFSPDFVMYSNDVQWDFQTYKDFHVQSYRERKAIRVQIDDLIGDGDKVAGRAAIELTSTNDVQQQIQVIFIIKVKNGKICELRELTFPHWQ
jgi:ketosteroid isomerase-like protein